MRSIAYHDDQRELPDDIRGGMTANRERAEAAYGRDELWKAIGPGHEEAWQYGYINGRIRAGRPVGLGPPAAGIVTGPPSAATGPPG